MKRNVALEIGPITSLLSNVDNDIIIVLYYAILHYNETSNLRRYLYELNHTSESLEMTEEQCLRPSDGITRERELQVG